jgi:hypothetical protein
MLTTYIIVGILSIIFLHGLMASITKTYFEYTGNPLVDGKEKWWFILLLTLTINMLYQLPGTIITGTINKINKYKIAKKEKEDLKIVEIRKLEKK